jgi:hypothetical protein
VKRPTNSECKASKKTNRRNLHWRKDVEEKLIEEKYVGLENIGEKTSKKSASKKKLTEEGRRVAVCKEQSWIVNSLDGRQECNTLTITLQQQDNVSATRSTY